MFSRIIIFILIIVIFIFLLDHFKIIQLENFIPIENFINLNSNKTNKMNKTNFINNINKIVQNKISSNKTNPNIQRLNDRFYGSKLNQRLHAQANQIEKADNANNTNNAERTQEIAEIDERILFNNRDYNENLSIDNKNNKYYYNDMISQSDINETAFNIVYSIDPIDYADVKTGIDKCNEKCGGICFENGYDGIATCYPTQPQGFDWGTLYKNPTFTYGYNAYGPEDLPQ